MKIQYAQGKSFATIEDESGKEALYQYRMGIIMNPEASRKLTVSGAGKALTQQNKRDRLDGEQHEDDAEDSAKRARLEDYEEEEEMEMSEEDESDGEAAGPTPAS